HAHNIHFLAYAACMADNFPEARKAADNVAAIGAAYIRQMPEMQGFLSNFVCAPFYILVAFERWDQILQLPKPSSLIPLAAWHFSRTLALAAKGNSGQAQQEQADW